jgi:hypothetical protein
MNEDRNAGVTEARFALTIVICLLVAVGYLVLARLGSSNEAVVEVRTAEPLRQPELVNEEDDQPQVLKVNGDDTPHVAERSMLIPMPLGPDAVIQPSSTDSQRR